MPDRFAVRGPDEFQVFLFAGELPHQINIIIKCDSVEKAMEMLEAEPDKYAGVWNTWGQHIWVIKRGCCGFKPVFAKSDSTPKDGVRFL